MWAGQGGLGCDGWLVGSGWSWWPRAVAVLAFCVLRAINGTVRPYYSVAVLWPYCNNIVAILWAVAVLWQCVAKPWHAHEPFTIT